MPAVRLALVAVPLIVYTIDVIAVPEQTVGVADPDVKLMICPLIDISEPLSEPKTAPEITRILYPEPATAVGEIVAVIGLEVPVPIVVGEVKEPLASDN